MNLNERSRASVVLQNSEISMTHHNKCVFLKKEVDKIKTYLSFAESHFKWGQDCDEHYRTPYYYV